MKAMLCGSNVKKQEKAKCNINVCALSKSPNKHLMEKIHLVSNIPIGGYLNNLVLSIFQERSLFVTKTK